MDMTGAVLLGPEYYKSYKITAPKRTHWRDATCEEVACERYVKGFYLEIDESSPLGQFQAEYIREDRTRSYIEEPAECGLTRFTFPPGNNCFGERHMKRIERPENFIVMEGDARGNPRGNPPMFLRSDQWVDDFACHQDMLSTVQKRG